MKYMWGVVYITAAADVPLFQAAEHVPQGFEAVSLLEALNGPLNPSPCTPALHGLTKAHMSGTLPAYGTASHHPATHSLSHLEHSITSSQGLKIKKSSSK